MPSYVTPKKNVAFVFYIGLPSVADANVFQANPTLASGDAKVSIDGGALNNLTTLPDVDPDASKLVKISLSSDEMNGDNIQVILSDVAGGEWKDVLINIQTTARQVDDLAFPLTSGRGILVAADGAISEVDLIAANGISGDSLSADALTDIAGALGTVLTTEVADSVATAGDRPSIAQGILMITRFLMEKSLSGVTMTVKKEDGTTANMTFTLNDSTAPTSISRAT